MEVDLKAKRREFWIVLIDDTPDQPDTSNRFFRVEHSPAQVADYGYVGGKPRCLDIVHVQEVPNESS